ncbi:hypothetical protein AZH53_02270 [Methanomicrobiaceae archaeon CYW5]|uniref:DUF134 domain-containing protein n=1 Tax=Methanovulcanius yangii TaxID=1789227 RepID=UPI0029CA5DEE|nr:DUF134 domain-containing protein [Methanovulcanius yangii]MBT8507255.1 hypothetical protein [Methanovulcanius yangii]
MRGCNEPGDPAGPRRGRPRKRRLMQREGLWRCYQPCCNPDDEGGTIPLHPEELEAIRLVDLLGHDQESAAMFMGVSRKTLWRDLHDGRRKIADALVNGKRIVIQGCELATSQEPCCLQQCVDDDIHPSSDDTK